MEKKLQIAVLIMAAGASRRMNGIKQLMPWKDSNFLLETVKTVQQSQANSLHIILGSNAEFITSECRFVESDISVIVNPNWVNGLGNSIAYGVKAVLKENTDIDGILICLADQPLLSSNYLNMLIKEFKENTSKTIATNYGKKVGVPALFPKLQFHNLSQLEGDFGAKELLNKNGNAIISLEASNQIIDIDTKLEYDKLINRTKTDINP
ncbi:nucleotidyltransferase family protein [Maribacter sp. SA7]|uniref:nucleotidyltransferase family protein n=1 Tax=Maribacter zhoushanensis TaxID=3030012 RepID=UPI0023EB1460|nr:nucleotidyltransferase family protein [Maribacter zhoushanensis]MDF4203059.1 nucleotidyltransferase family protein [Maribacter zhoushanensis]